MIDETNLKYTQEEFESKIWYGNPENEIIEGTIKGIETDIHIYNNKEINKKEYKIEHLELIKQYIWDFNLDNKFIKTNKLCCINLKNKFSINEFIQATQTYISYITNIRIFLSPKPNIYYILLEFKNIEYCNIFYNTYNYSKINPIEDEYLFFVQVDTIIFDEIYSNSKRKSSLDKMEIDTSNNKNINNITDIEVDDNRICTICIENLENNYSMNNNKNITGIIYVLCGHAFHLDCFTKLEDDKCPLCRYYLSPSNIITCEQCLNEKDLWMCLICGHICCGEEGGSYNHRYEHYKQTGHIYTQGLGDKHNIIFDFTKNAPVHIWIQNSIICNNNNENNFNNNNAHNNNNNNGNHFNNNNDNNSVNNQDEIFKNPKEKSEYIMSEYNSIISSQLESQRVYYLNKLRQMEEDAVLQQKDILKAKEELKEVEKDLEISENEKNTVLKQVKEKNEKKNLLLMELKKTEDDYKILSDEKNKSDKSKNNIYEDYDKIIDEQDKQIEDLNQQLKDLKIHLTTKNKIEKSNDGIKNASLGLILDVEQPKNKRRNTKHKNK